MALILRRAGHGVAARACSGLARVCLGTRIAVITRRAVGLVRIGTRSRRRIARPRIVALIQCRARHRIGSGAGSGLARVCLGTRIAVITRRAVGLVRIGTHARCRITRPRIVALIQCRTRHRIAAITCARLTRVRLGTRIAVITRRAVRFARIGTHARRGIARPRVVALILRRTRDRRAARTNTGLATIELRAGIAVITRAAIDFFGIGTLPRSRITFARVVAIIRRFTNHAQTRIEHAYGRFARTNVIRFDLAIRIASVPFVEIAVVAPFAGIQQTIAARRQSVRIEIREEPRRSRGKRDHADLKIARRRYDVIRSRYIESNPRIFRMRRHRRDLRRRRRHSVQQNAAHGRRGYEHDRMARTEHVHRNAARSQRRKHERRNHRNVQLALHEARVLKDVRRLRRFDERHAGERRFIILTGIDRRHHRAIDAHLRIVRIRDDPQGLRQNRRVIIHDELRSQQIRGHEVIAAFITAPGEPPSTTDRHGNRLRRRNQCAVEVHTELRAQGIRLSGIEGKRMGQTGNAVIPKRCRRARRCRHRNVRRRRGIKRQEVKARIVRIRRIERIRARAKTRPQSDQLVFHGRRRLPRSRRHALFDNERRRIGHDERAATLRDEIPGNDSFGAGEWNLKGRTRQRREGHVRAAIE